MKQPTILVGTWSGGLHAITDDGPRKELANEPVRGLATVGSGGALALVGRNSLRRRAFDGVWEIIATSTFDLSCCMTVRETIYVGTEDARPLRLSNKDNQLEPVDSFDHVAGRHTWFAGSAIVNGERVGPPLGIRSVASNASGRVLFASVHVGGIPRSIDGGMSWQPTIDINSDVHEVCADRTDPEVVVAAAAIGLCISRDSGTTWTTESEGLHASQCYAAAISGDDILISAAEHPFAAEGKIYRRPLRADGILTAVEGGMPMWTEGIVDTACIASSGSFVAVADKGGNLYSSDDFGRTWSRRATGLPAPSSVLIC